MIDIQKKDGDTKEETSKKISAGEQKSSEAGGADAAAGEKLKLLWNSIKENFPKVKNFFYAFIGPKVMIPMISTMVLFITLVVLLIYVHPNAVPACGDGSPYASCSADKPYYCSYGVLVENASECGCPPGSTGQGNSCISLYQNGSVKQANFSYVLDGKENSANFTMYTGLYNYLFSLPDSITSSDGKLPQRADFALKRINESYQKALLAPLVKEIENLVPGSKVDQARVAISLVQNIPWGSSGKKITFGGFKVDYSRYPYQVLYDNQGLCEEKSELLAFMLRDLGYGVVLFYYPQENHETVGIKCPMSESLNGTGYCFVETSGPAIISDSNLVYANGEKLNSSFQVVPISNGISLPTGLAEYGDAKKLTRLTDKEWLNPISSMTLNALEKKYGLGQAYNIN